MSDALSSDEPERARLPGDAWYPGAAYEQLRAHLCIQGMLRCGDQERGNKALVPQAPVGVRAERRMQVIGEGGRVKCELLWASQAQVA